MFKKFTFLAIWVLTLALPLYTIYTHTNFLPLKGNISLQINLAQRISGFIAFTLLFWQIILGAFLDFWEKKLGKWVLNFHILQGMVVNLLILIHPLLFGLYFFKIRGVFDPFYVFADVCVLCKNKLEIFYTLGRVGVIFSLTAAAVVVFKQIDPWLKKNWRSFHILNYPAFLLVAVHAKLLGDDINFMPFNWFYWFAVVTVVITVFYKIIIYFRRSI